MDTGGTVRASRVFVTNFAGHDYTKAERYGEIVYITKGYVSFFSLDRIKYRVCEALQGSTEDDWLLLSGIPMICVVAACYWLWKHDKVKLLVHDKRSDGNYRELIISDKNFADLFAVLNHGA
jgi:hypothetical protein